MVNVILETPHSGGGQAKLLLLQNGTEIRYAELDKHNLSFR